MSHTAIAILNYNGEKLLAKFLPSVIRHASGAEVIVIDNGSTDQSLGFLQKTFPSVRIVALDNNYGFCGGYNRGLKQINADFFVLLNSDVEVTSNWLDPMLKIFADHPDVSAVQPKILSYNQRDHFEYAGAGGGYIDTLGYPFCRGRVFEYAEHDHAQYNDTRPIFWSTGACMCIRSTAYHQFNGLDEDFFAHMEEIDLCWKLHRANQKVMYCGESAVFHLGAGTLGYSNPRKTYLNFRNGLFLVYRHLDGGELFYKFPVRIILDWLAAAMYLLKGEWSHTRAVLKSHIDFMMNFGRERRKRRILMHQFPAYSRATVYKGSIVFDYFIRRQKVIDVNQ